MLWKHDGTRAVAITDEGDRLTVWEMRPRSWWAVRLWDSNGSEPDREGYEPSFEDAKRVAIAAHRELRAQRPGHAPIWRRLKSV